MRVPIADLPSAPKLRFSLEKLLGNPGSVQVREHHVMKLLWGHGVLNSSGSLNWFQQLEMNGNSKKSLHSHYSEGDEEKDRNETMRMVETCWNLLKLFDTTIWLIVSDLDTHRPGQPRPRKVTRDKIKTRNLAKWDTGNWQGADVGGGVANPWDIYIYILI